MGSVTCNQDCPSARQGTGSGRDPGSPPGSPTMPGPPAADGRREPQPLLDRYLPSCRRGLWKWRPGAPCSHYGGG